MTTATVEQNTTPLDPRSPLTREELKGKNHQIQVLCLVHKPDGSVRPVSMAHISRILNPDQPNTPSLGMARRIARALSQVLDREVAIEDVAVYLEEELGKSLDWPKDLRV